MIVLQLGPYPPPHGGVQTNLVGIREHLRQRYGPKAAPVINLTRHRKDSVDDVYYPTSALGVAKLLLTIPADIIHLHIGGRFTTRLLALCLFCSLIPNRRTVMTFHSGGYPSWQKRLPGRFSLRRLIVRRLDRVIAVNTEIAALFRALGVEHSRCQIICPYTPATVREDVELPATLARFRSAHDPLLTTVGLLEPEYDLPLQIDALGAVREKLPDAGLVIIGSGSLDAELRRRIANEPFADHILLCGDVPHGITLQMISMSDAFLRTTLYDGDSVSVREALQMGVPVIASDNGMRPPGVILVPRSNALAVRDAIVGVVGQLSTARDVRAGDQQQFYEVRGEQHLPATSDGQHFAELLDMYASLGERNHRRVSACR